MEPGPPNNDKVSEVDCAALNEGLILGLVRQHGLTEAAELLNELLQAEIVARKKAEDALVRSEKLASVDAWRLSWRMKSTTLLKLS